MSTIKFFISLIQVLTLAVGSRSEEGGSPRLLLEFHNLDPVHALKTVAVLVDALQKAAVHKPVWGKRHEDMENLWAGSSSQNPSTCLTREVYASLLRPTSQPPNVKTNRAVEKELQEIGLKDAAQIMTMEKVKWREGEKKEELLEEKAGVKAAREFADWRRMGKEGGGEEWIAGQAGDEGTRPFQKTLSTTVSPFSHSSTNRLRTYHFWTLSPQVVSSLTEADRSGTMRTLAHALATSRLEDPVVSNTRPVPAFLDRSFDYSPPLDYEDTSKTPLSPTGRSLATSTKADNGKDELPGAEVERASALNIS